MASMPDDNGVHTHLCTIASKPRIPEHCIQYALIIEWPLLTEFKNADTFKMKEKPKESEIKEDNVKQVGAVELDKDDIEHMTWIYNRAVLRASQFDIKGVTFSMTQQVVKNIIPAIASTNALIASACVLEVSPSSLSLFFLSFFPSFFVVLLSHPVFFPCCLLGFEIQIFGLASSG
jgi:ubiquitin-activating enzyme E1 C